MGYVYNGARLHPLTESERRGGGGGGGKKEKKKNI